MLKVLHELTEIKVKRKRFLIQALLCTFVSEEIQQNAREMKIFLENKSRTVLTYTNQKLYTL